jgi:hypothetical protein
MRSMHSRSSGLHTKQIRGNHSVFDRAILTRWTSALTVLFHPMQITRWGKYHVHAKGIFMKLARDRVTRDNPVKKIDHQISRGGQCEGQDGRFIFLSIESLGSLQLRHRLMTTYWYDKDYTSDLIGGKITIYIMRKKQKKKKKNGTVLSLLDWSHPIPRLGLTSPPRFRIFLGVCSSLLACIRYVG